MSQGDEDDDDVEERSPVTGSHLREASRAQGRQASAVGLEDIPSMRGGSPRDVLRKSFDYASYRSGLSHQRRLGAQNFVGVELSGISIL